MSRDIRTSGASGSPKLAGDGIMADRQFVFRCTQVIETSLLERLSVAAGCPRTCTLDDANVGGCNVRNNDGDIRLSAQDFYSTIVYECAA